MNISIAKSTINGNITVPSSKSYTIRGLICAALANGTSELKNPLGSKDTEACRGILENLGITIEEHETSWIVQGNGLHATDKDLYCHESAATQRFMAAVAAVVPGTSRLTAAPALKKRPIEPMIQPLAELGISSNYHESDGSLSVNGGTLKGGATTIAGNISSQYISGLLFIAPLAETETVINLSTPLESWPYVLMTLDCMKAFGIDIDRSEDMRMFRSSPQRYTAASYTIEGDWSSASYPLSMGAIAGETRIFGLNPQSAQADKKLLDFLKEMGASIEIKDDTIVVRRSDLKAIHADLTDCIDMLPTMGVLAAVANGTSELTGIARARIKESNRVASVKNGLEKMGIPVIEETDRLIITGAQPRGAVIDSCNDHRIAMAFSLLGLLAGNTVIEGAECVAKTYPEFWDILESIGGEVQKNG